VGNDSGANVTRRQRIAELLAEGEWTFEELRRELELPVHLLEDDLHHVERSSRSGGGGRLRAEPPRCLACGFTFRDRAPRRFQPPGRCPQCRSERIAPGQLRIG
jgi:predicted Zn-ribbon and HTH transcriptional regulator